MSEPNSLPINDNAVSRFSRCPSCGSREIVYAFRIDGDRLDECTVCDLVFRNPQPCREAVYELPEHGRVPLHPVEVVRPALNSGSAKILLELVADYCGWPDKAQRQLLDVGCGEGILMVEAASMGFKVCGLDICEGQVQRARSRNPEAELYHGDILTMNIAMESFDLCIISAFLEHVRDPVAVLRLVWSLLKSDGVLVVTTPSLDSVSSRWMKGMWTQFKPEHMFYFRPGNLQTLIYRTGFRSIRMHPLRKVVDLDYLQSHLDRLASRSVLGRALCYLPKVVPDPVKKTPFTLGGSEMVALATKSTRPDPQLVKLIFDSRKCKLLLNQYVTRTIQEFGTTRATAGWAGEVLVLEARDL